MLESIAIRDFALIENLTIEWTSGLNVLTGETGAGKSIIIDALNAVLGGKSGAGAIRSGAKKASIEACFHCSPLVAAWLKTNKLVDDNPEQLIIAKEITKAGSRLRINGTLVNHSLSQELGELLLTIHAQHEAKTLLSNQYQLDMLDSLGDVHHKKLLEKVRTLYASQKELLARQWELSSSEEDRLRRLEFARFQLKELEEATLDDAEEDEELDRRHKILAHAAQLEELVRSAYDALNGSDIENTSSAADLVQKSLAEMEKAVRIDASLQETITLLHSSLATLEEAATNLRRYAGKLDTDPESLALVESRLGVLIAIKRKYGPALAEAIERQHKLASDIDNWENSQIKIDEINNELKIVQQKLKDAADELSLSRQALSNQLSRQVEMELADLGMGRCKFSINSVSHNEIGPGGQERAEFVIAPNPGQPFMPLSKIASGGELSRIMLAIKCIFASADQVSTVIFDEIDAGLSGNALQSVRDKLARLAKSHQILCITHQPVIAAVADNHVEIQKHQSTESTRVTAHVLSSQERLAALANLASGQGDEEVALNFARSLIEQANQLK